MVSNNSSARGVLNIFFESNMVADHLSTPPSLNNIAADTTKANSKSPVGVLLGPEIPKHVYKAVSAG